MKFVRAFLCALLLAFQLSPAFAWIHGSISTKTGQVTMNINGGGTVMFLNLAKGLSCSSSQAGWPGALTSNGFPTNSLSSNCNSNNLSLIPNYYGHYKLWWSNTGAFNMSGFPLIAYSGGTAVSGIAGASGSVSNNPSIGQGTATQPSSGTPLEFTIGALVNAVTDAGTGACATAGGTSGLVCLTSTLSGAVGNLTTGINVQVNNVTNLSSGPWTITKLDSSHVQLQGSTYSGTMSINGGSPGAASELIVNASAGSLSWGFPASSGSVNYSNMSAMVICRSQNVGYNGTDDCTAIGAGGHYVNPDYVTAFKAPNLNPRWIRFMDVIGVIYNFSTNYTYRPSTTQFSWGGTNFVPAYWAGEFTNTADAFVTASNPTASPSSGGPVDGEIVEGYISATNTTHTPTLAVNRSGFGLGMPILTNSASKLSLTMTGSVPPTATTISLVFTGGGLASPFTYNYLTSTSVNGPGGKLDTSFSNIASNIIADINTNARGNAGALVTANIVGENPEVSAAQMSFGHNPNINSSGVAALGNGLSITGSDSASSASYNFGWLQIGYFSASNDNVTCTFSGIAQGWICVDNGTALPGPNGGPPLEWYEDLATSANVGIYYNFPVLYSDTSINSTVQHFANAGVKELVVGVSNETWNTAGGGQWHLINSLGQYVGLPSAFDGGSAVDGYTALRMIQVATQARSAWSTAGRSQAQLFVSNEYQFVSTGTLTQRLSGSALNPSSNVTLAAYGGSPSNQTTTPSGVSTNYAASPNRPVDWSDFVAPAPYFQGALLNAGNGSSTLNPNGSGTISQYNCMLVAAYNYAYGNSTNQAASLNWMFNPGTISGDFYTTTNVGGSSYTSGNSGFQLGTWANGSGISGPANYFGIGTIVSGYDAGRTGTNPHTGLAWQPLGVAAYEGDADPAPESTGDATNFASQFTTMGYTNGYTSSLGGTYCGMTVVAGGPTGSSDTASQAATNVFAMMTAFKQSSNFQALYAQYFSDFKAATILNGNRIAVPATYGFESPKGYWSKYPSNVIYSTPWKSWNAIQAADN